MSNFLARLKRNFCLAANSRIFLIKSSHIFIQCGPVNHCPARRCRVEWKRCRSEELPQSIGLCRPNKFNSPRLTHRGPARVPKHKKSPSSLRLAPGESSKSILEWPFKSIKTHVKWVSLRSSHTAVSLSMTTLPSSSSAFDADNALIRLCSTAIPKPPTLVPFILPPTFQCPFTVLHISEQR